MERECDDCCENMCEYDIKWYENYCELCYTKAYYPEEYQKHLDHLDLLHHNKYDCNECGFRPKVDDHYCKKCKPKKKSKKSTK